MRWIKGIIICLIVCLMYTTVLAGDYPDSIMAGLQKAHFIGQIIEMDEVSYTIKPITIMMGEIEESELVVDKFEKYHGTSDQPRIGDYFIARLLEDNKLDEDWLLKTTSSDYKELKLVSEPHNMVQLYEEYINAGKYLEAQKTLDREKQAEQEKALSQTQKHDGDETTIARETFAEEKDNNNLDSIWIVGITVVSIVVIGSLMLRIKSKKKVK